MIPALLAVGAVHHHLIRQELRMQCSLICETGEARETHHFACLIGYGASAINPYLALDTAREAVQRGRVRDKTCDENAVVKNYVKAAEKGLLKVMSKMGIADRRGVLRRADLRGRRPAPGPDRPAASPARPRRIGGMRFSELARDVLMWHANAYPADVERGRGAWSG